ncbi:hypothetical protein Nepgr_020583 [Nepenthes gracilis]|uniref:rRNA biogenesis protein RRP5 n=1 Tax=Nepenthes gracilis TaxID=150966 RepID=A0AAD3SX78_NEPGR|nr:hypothetical protein Nepgr_020583 [Nepenthes gracilis]
MAAANRKTLKRKYKDNPKNSSYFGNGRDAAAQSQTLPLQLDVDVPDFPRGGRSSLTREDRDEIRAEVDADFDAEMRPSKKKKRKKMMKTGDEATEEDLGSLFGDGIIGKLPRFANKITLKNISPGMKLWGVIAEVNEKDLVVSLPGGLHGLVRASEALDMALVNNIKDGGEGGLLSSIFNVGQLLSCVVLEVDEGKKEMGKRKIWLSLRLSLLHKGFSLDVIQEGMVLTAYVKSVEDHGYILHFGLSSFTGFLPRTREEDCREIQVNAGQFVHGVVRSIDKARKVVHLCCDAVMVSKCVTKDLKGISLDILVPGMMVNARVQAILENGIMLSFLTYFTGTVDIFHLQSMFPTSAWKKEYDKNKKVNARILFIDPSTRAVGLTMNPHLLLNKAPPLTVKTGGIYDQSTIVRIDKGLGLLLQIPSEPVPSPAYVTMSNVSDEEVQKLEKKFKEGSLVRARILGYRHLEGLAMGILKASAFEGSVFTHSDVKPGMVLKAKVVAVKSTGAIVQFPGGIKALCPLQHMSEFDISTPRKKFKVGAELLFRVLGCKSKRITVTHKKTLVKSKLSILSSYADATVGLVTHGWITKVEIYGCFVRFYNGVQGFAPRSELGLEPGCDIRSRYHVGEVVKCRVTSSIPASRRINLSFIISPTRVSEDDVVKLGSLVSGVVEHVTSRAVLLHVNVKGNMKGTIFIEHLADHQGLASLMKSLLKPGHEFPELLVLDIEGNNLVLTAKFSLIQAAQELPLDYMQIHPHSVIHGYICNIIGTGCFVRFLGRLTGFCPRKKAADDQEVDTSEAFYIGQSVRSHILDVNSESGQITVSLKQSCCSSSNASFLQSYFLTAEKIAELQVTDSRSLELNWAENFNIGCVVKGKINEVKDFGVVISFEHCTNVFGFITQYQLGGMTIDAGFTVQAVVLDIAKAERLVDLSLKPEFVNRNGEDISRIPASKKKRKREACEDLKVHTTVNATVEIVKEEYLVLSLPEYNYAIGYAGLSDYNTQKLSRRQFSSGESVVATVISLPSSSPAGRLLLLLESLRQATETSSSKRAKRKSSYDVGSVVQAEVTEMKPLELRLKFGIGFRGRIHITEVADGVDAVEKPFCNYKVGQTLTARIVAKYTQHDSNKKGYQWELSVKPSLIAGSIAVKDKLMVEDFNFSAGQRVSGYVYKVDNDWIWLAVSRHVNAQLFILDSSSEPNELEEFQRRFKTGSIVCGYILRMNRDKRLLRLVLRPFSSLNGPASEFINARDVSNAASEEIGISHIHEGDILGGRIWKILPGIGGLLVQIGPHLYGKVHFTELTGAWLPEPLSGYHEGQFVKCKVLEIKNSVKGTVHLDLSFRSYLDGILSHNSGGSCTTGNSPGYRVEKIEDLHPDTVIQGYVKNVSSKGCFILLSRNVDAKILLSNLSDGYVEDPEKEFPIGKLVTGKVLSVEPLSKRVEVTLKTSNACSTTKPDFNDLNRLHVGDVVSGMVKRVESFGLFIMINNTNVIGLCHVSELSDDHVDSTEDKYRAGDRVTAKVLKVDKERHRVSLGMKTSYMKEGINTQLPSTEKTNEAVNGNDYMENTLFVSQLEDGMPDISNSDAEYQIEEDSVLVEAKSRASILPLEVMLDDAEETNVDDNVLNSSQKDSDCADVVDEKSKRRAKRKAKEEKEQEIRAAEERLLDGDAPRSVDEYEKLVRSSPNNSFVWMKYMSFMLHVGDVEGARSIAERALGTINIRYEAEKLNIWVAYLNLENEYGNPPEEAVMSIFQRALQYCDPLKVHLQLLGLYERTEQHKLADDHLEKMVKKFRHSTEVWLRQIQWLLKQNKDQVENVINRALLSLPRHEHIKFLSQVALLEYKCGVPDRGRSIFEKILREYPKRRDLWSVYLDQEIRLGDVDLIRALFERATSLSLSAKKMKFLFKKYLNYEKSLGDDDRVQYVVQKAKEFIETTNV